MFRAVIPPLLVVAALGLAMPQSDSLRMIEREIARAERSELREPGSDRFFHVEHERLQQARRQIEAYLQAKPNDAEALVLLGRVGRFILARARTASCGGGLPCVLDNPYHDAPFHSAFDRALTLRNRDAAAHFWKARLLADGRPVIRDGDFAIDLDTTQMLAHARQAVRFDPRNLRYREFWATALLLVGRYSEAAEVIAAAQSGNHPLYLMLQDLNAVPVPAGAVPWPDGHAAFAAVGLDENPPRFAGFSGRSWVTPLSIDELEAFYRARWPDFRFFRAPADSGREAAFQYLRLVGGRLQPAQDSGFMARFANAAQFEGVLMGVRQEGLRFKQADERYPAAVAGKDAFSEIILVTGRKGPHH